MSYNLSFSLINFIIDFSIIILVNFYCKLYNKPFEIFMTLVFSCIPSTILIYLKIKIYQFIFLKIIDYFILTLIITDNYDLGRINFIFSIFIFMMFSIFGFCEFFIAFAKIVIFQLFNIAIPIIYDFFIIFAVFIYLFFLIIFFGKLSKKKTIEKYLYKVSFFLFDKHIKINGLLDSGNSVYDSKTGKAVVIISLETLKKYIEDTKYKNFLAEDYSKLSVINKIYITTVGGKNTLIPIIDIGEIKIEELQGNSEKKYKCVLGITKENFAKGKEYECLLHSEFL